MYPSTGYVLFDVVIFLIILVGVFILLRMLIGKL